jgi:hypothetical protein
VKANFRKIVGASTASEIAKEFPMNQYPQKVLQQQQTHFNAILSISLYQSIYLSFYLSNRALVFQAKKA